MTILEQLTAARSRVAKSWTKGASARTQFGDIVHPHDSHAVSFCLYGAVRAGAFLGYDHRTTEVLVRALPPGWTNAAGCTPKVALTSFNDDRGTSQTDVLALLDRAINRYPGGWTP